ncbi:tRNA-dihydrouridine synthase [Spirochaetia bacterium]|nr:tRNA-dihydrouridine synthase [Spirochaetia bacterium]
MAELSHRALRELIAGFEKPGIGGCDEYFTEMISAGALVGGGRFESFYSDAGPCPERVVYQLVGSKPAQIAEAAAILDGLPCAGIDINMGCSAPAITRLGAGVRWMASIDEAGDLIRQVRPRTRRRLSVKLRIGLEDDFDYLVKFCRRLEAEGVDRVTLHPRTAREKFRRTARWDYVGRLRDSLGIPVAGNGDIANAGELLHRASSGACDAVMVGRAALRAPWIFAQAKGMWAAEETMEHDEQTGTEWNGGKTAAPGSLAVKSDDAVTGTVHPAKFILGEVNLEETALRFLELLARYQPPEFHISRARRFFNYYCDNLVWAHYIKTRLNRETDLAGIEAVLRGYFREHTEERQLRLNHREGN